MDMPFGVSLSLDRKLGQEQQRTEHSHPFVTRISPRTSASLRSVQAVLRPDELLLEYALAEPTSFVLVIASIVLAWMAFQK